VPDVTDWKAKHLSALREMEVEERRWRDAEQILRRLVNRLCAAAMGIDARLDAQLTKLAEANRRAADVAELSARHDSLSDALKALDAVPGGRPPIDFSATIVPTSRAAAPPVPTARLEASRSAAARLVGELTATGPVEPKLQELAARLGEAASDSVLAEILSAIADVIGARAAAIAAEREAAAAVLTQVTERLQEMADYLSGLSGERQAQLDDAETLNEKVLSQVSQLSAEALSATDLALLRARVAERLESVASQVREFREREGKRFVEHSARAEKLRARIGELERDSRELNRSLEQERRRSRQDALTRIPNRTVFEERLAEEIRRWHRFRTSVSVLVWDIDHFKTINDRFGHRVGDAVLREVAACLASRLRNTDLVARYGGEEFCMILIGISLQQALKLADELRASIQALGFHLKGAPVTVTASCGLTEIRDGDTADTVFDRADHALYSAKNSGRNCCTIG
jgi:diguanylate cyclase